MKTKIPSRALPRLDSKIEKSKQKSEKSQDDNSVLAERARQFVNRIQKQKSYEDGRAVIRRKKEEQARLKKMKE